MARQQYETQKDRDAEARIAEFYREWRSFERAVKQTPEFGPDFKMFDHLGALAGLLECKDRNGDWLRDEGGLPFEFRDGYYMASHKVEKAMGLVTSLGVPCEIAVRFKGWEVYCAPIDSFTGEVWGGRKDRQDKADMEWEKVYPWGAFEKIGRLVD